LSRKDKEGHLFDKGVRQDFDKAKDYCFKLFKFRLRSEREIRDRLKRKRFSPDIIENIIVYFKGLNLINDSQFTKSWIESRLKKPFGLKRIIYELKDRGISEKIIAEEIQETKKGYSEYEIVKRIVEEKFTPLLHPRSGFKRQISRIDPNKIKRKIYSFLLRKGFSSDTILDVLSEIS